MREREKKKSRKKGVRDKKARKKEGKERMVRSGDDVIERRG